MNLLTISSLYPNNIDQKHGIFVETRLRHLLHSAPEITSTVIAPVPWFPFQSTLFGEYARFANVHKKEIRHGVTIYHPKYLVLPKIGMYITPYIMGWAIKRMIKKLINQGHKIDLIDGHYFFPDGIAIAIAAKKFNLPFTCTARGTDINLIPQYPRALRLIKKVFEQASHMMTVCQALKDEMLTLGVKNEQVTVLRNGVDLNTFKLSTEDEQQTLKDNLGIKSRLIVSVGWLIERKGHHLVIEAMQHINDATLIIIGDGPEHQSLKALVEKYQLDEKVTFLGAKTQEEVSRWFQAADCTVLASSREGWANVLLESMASGTSVVATKVWGTPEVVATEEAGVLVERNSLSIAQGIEDVLSNNISRKKTREYAEQFDWLSTSLGQQAIFNSILRNTSNENTISS